MTETVRSAVNLRSLYWVGPATVAVATLAVALAQRVMIPLVGGLPPPLRFPMLSAEPLVFTAILVTAAIVVFAVIAENAADPLRTFRRVADIVLVVSFVPNIVAAVSVGDNAWRSALALAALHVVAWGVTIAMLTKLTPAARRRRS
jgi:hypothetical protein